VSFQHQIGVWKTLYNRYVRWAGKGVWKNLFHALASAGGPPEQVLISAAMPSRTNGRASRRPDQRKKKGRAAKPAAQV
jgi:transposase